MWWAEGGGGGGGLNSSSFIGMCYRAVSSNSQGLSSLKPSPRISIPMENNSLVPCPEIVGNHQ